MDDLVAFLRARLDEREKPLREVVRQLDAYADGDEDGIDGGWSLWGSFGRAIDTAFRPRELLADVEAKRKIIFEHGDNGMFKHDDNGDLVRAGPLGDRCTSCLLTDDPLAAEAGSEFAEMAPYPCRTLRLLALPYAGHPDYREEWKP